MSQTPKIHLFYAEDRPEIAQILKEFLELEHLSDQIDIVEFTHGAAIIDHLRTNAAEILPPDFLLTDYRMPFADGIEVIKTAQTFTSIPDTNMAVYGVDDLKAECDELGVGFFQKIEGLDPILRWISRSLQ